MDTSTPDTTPEHATPLSPEEMTREVLRITWLGLWLNVALATIKFLAGWFGHSKVLVADAVHSLSDLITDFAVLFGMRYWSRPADDDHQYGHAKIETLVTLFIGVALAAVGLGLAWDAVDSLLALLRGAEREPPTVVPLIAALISIAAKEWLYKITERVGMRIKSSAVVANAWHHRSDAFSSIPAALAVGCCLLFGESYAFLDPVGTVAVAFMIVHASLHIIRPAVAELLDTGAPLQTRKEIVATVSLFREVLGLHKMRTRRVGPRGFAVDMHIQVDPDMPVHATHALSHRIQRLLYQNVDQVVDVFIHIEPAGLDQWSRPSIDLLEGEGNREVSK